MEIYIVKSGDTVDSIALSFGIPASTIIYNNQLIYPYELAIGQALLISTGSVYPKYPAYISGYAYPFISQDILNESLPSLSSLLVFSYGFSSEGDLIAPLLDDQFMINTAYSYDVSPVLTLTPFGADGRFNNNLISSVTNNEAAKNNLYQNLLATLVEKGFQGVDVDFEYILADDRLPFVSFVSDLREFLNPYGYFVSVALAPKTDDNQQGLLYEGKDYALLGEAANHVLLMTYEWGYTYGPPMAVAPLNKVRQVVEYALTRIPSEKINLGIPNYGYDWTLPYIRGTSAAQPLGSIDAMRLAASMGVPILFDEVAMSPYFQYSQNGVMHEVWFEDARSLLAKFSLLPAYQLRGIGIWQIMRLFRTLWLLSDFKFDIIKEDYNNR